MTNGKGFLALCGGVLACVLTAIGAGPASADIQLVFGLYTSDKPSTMVQQFRPALNVLEERLTDLLSEPVKIRTRVAKSYDDGLKDLVDGTVDFARFGPASYILAKRQQPGLSILAVEQNEGGNIFYGVICVREDSDIENVAQLKGRTFAFGDENSTIGRYLSQLYLLNHGITAGDLASYNYLGRHDLVGSVVATGQYDAGALMEKSYNELVASGMPLRIIAEFPNVTKPWIARAGLPDRIKVAISRALFSLDDPVALDALSKDGFVEGTDTDYDVIRESMDRNGEFFGNVATSTKQ
jgi:phosphate/phosphite/phosphonate ABC transporter binding protein